MYCVKFTVFNVHCRVYNVYCTLYTVQCTVYILNYTYVVLMEILSKMYLLVLIDMMGIIDILI